METRKQRPTEQNSGLCQCEEGKDTGELEELGAHLGWGSCQDPGSEEEPVCTEVQESFLERHKCTESQGGSRLRLLGIIKQSQGPINKWKMLWCKETVDDLRGGEGRVWEGREPGKEESGGELKGREGRKREKGIEKDSKGEEWGQRKKREQRKGEMEREGKGKGGEQERGILELEVTDYTHVMG